MSPANALVIGGGPAGYTAALYLARAGLEPLCIEGYAAGGQLLLTGHVENFPGFPEGILGPDLVTNIRTQAERFGARFELLDVTAVDLSQRPFRVFTGADEHRAHALVLATGATAKPLGLESELALQNRGVAYCSVCDGPLFAGRRVAVVGGGDAAMDEALSLSRIADQVVLVHRRRGFRASQVMVDRVRATPNIELLIPYTVDEVLGVEEGRLNGLALRDAETNQVRIEPMDAMFVAIGHTPNSKLFADAVACDEDGYVLVDPGSSRTSVEGVFAAGDVHDRHFRQAITSAGSGCIAALEAERWLAVQDVATERVSASAAYS
jgi:thioredoxin reductase (NADPH)